MVLPSVWGPKLWIVLHGIGRIAGRSPFPVRRDEERELKWLIDRLETIVPCPECRAHIESYRKEHPPPLAAAEVGQWFWQFHNAVNKRLNKPEIPMPIGGEPTKVIDSWKVYQTTIKESLLKGVLRQDAINDFGRHLRMWQGFCA